MITSRSSLSTYVINNLGSTVFAIGNSEFVARKFPFLKSMRYHYPCKVQKLSDHEFTIHSKSCKGNISSGTKF